MLRLFCYQSLYIQRTSDKSQVTELAMSHVIPSYPHSSVTAQEQHHAKSHGDQTPSGWQKEGHQGGQQTFKEQSAEAKKATLACRKCMKMLFLSHLGYLVTSGISIAVVNVCMSTCGYPLVLQELCFFDGPFSSMFYNYTWSLRLAM